MAIDAPQLATRDLGWHGLQLRLPAEWNLSAFHGTAFKGSLIVSDLRGPRLIARWRKPAGWRKRSNSAPHSFEKLAAALRGRQPAAEFSALAENALQIDLATGERLLLAHNHDRLFELHWPEKPAPADALGSFFLQSLREIAGDWKWQIFGIFGHAPAYARLRSARLQAGATEIALISSQQALTLGALSLADRLLHNSTLKKAAEARLRLDHLPGQWQESDRALSFSGSVARKLLPGKISFGFHILHDPAANLIRWNLTTSPGFYKIWRSR